MKARIKRFDLHRNQLMSSQRSRAAGRIWLVALIHRHESTVRVVVDFEIHIKRSLYHLQADVLAELLGRAVFRRHTAKTMQRVAAVEFQVTIEKSRLWVWFKPILKKSIYNISIPARIDEA